MNKIISNKYLRIIISILLVIVILFNFTLKPKAEAIAIGLAIKVIITVLASMGILTVITNNMSIENFFTGFTTWLQQVKGVQNSIYELEQIAVRAIITGGKMKVNQLVNWLKEYYYSIKTDLVYTNTNLYDYNVIAEFEDNRVGIFSNIITGTDKINIQDKYELRVSKSVSQSPYGWKSLIKFNITLIEKESGVEVIPYRKEVSFKIPPYPSESGTLNYKVQLADQKLLLAISVGVYSINDYFYSNNIWDVPKLIGIDEIPSLPSLNPDVPVPQSVPYDGLAIPYEQLLNQNELIGKNIEDVLEEIKSIDTQSFIKEMEQLNKNVLDSLEQTKLIIDENNVVVDIEVPEYPDIVPDIKEQTGILGNISNILHNIQQTIKDIFTIPEGNKKLDLDFTPITNIGITEKFPFSLPWDIADTIGLLVAPPAPPSWSIDLLGNKLQIDFTVFDEWAMISRTFFTIIFIAGLIILTRRFLG